VNFNFLGSKFQIFKGAWKIYLNEGIDWFLMDLPIGGTEEMTLCQVRFVSDYSFSYNSPYNVDVSASIEFFEVQSADELALFNLTSVGSPLPFPDATIREVTYTNKTTGGNAYAAISSSQGPYAVQWWDGTITTNNSVAFLVKLMPATSAETYFRTLQWKCVSLADPTPVPNTAVRVIAGSSAGFIKYLDLNEYPSEPVNSIIDMNNTYEWEPDKFGGTTLLIPVEGQLSSCRISRTEKPTTLAFKYKTAGYVLQNGINMSYMPQVTSVTFEHETPGELCRAETVIFSFDMNFDNGNGHVDWSSLHVLDIAGEGSAATNTFDLSFNDNIQELTLGKTSNRTIMLIDNNPQLAALNFVNPSTFNYINLRDCNFSVAAIKAFIDDVTPAPGLSGISELQLGGNPCWVVNQLDQTHPDTPYVEAACATKGILLVTS